MIFTTIGILNREKNMLYTVYRYIYLTKKKIKKKMSFPERIEEDEIYQRIYEKIIFDEFHKRVKQLKQENNKRYVY